MDPTSLSRRRSLVALGLLACAACPAPEPAESVVDAPTAIALDVQYFVAVLGRFTTDGFADALREELAKYHVRVVGSDESPSRRVRIELGAWTDRSSAARSLTIAMMGDGGKYAAIGYVRVPDLDLMTLDIAAGPVAELIARAARA